MSRLTCYSDHNHDIGQVGECGLCGGTWPDGAATGKRIAEPTPPTTLLPDVLPVCREVVERHQYLTPIVDGSELMIDALTASVVTQVYDRLSDTARAKADAMAFRTFVNIAWKLVK